MLAAKQLRSKLLWYVLPETGALFQAVEIFHAAGKARCTLTFLLFNLYQSTRSTRERGTSTRVGNDDAIAVKA